MYSRPGNHVCLTNKTLNNNLAHLNVIQPFNNLFEKKVMRVKVYIFTVVYIIACSFFLRNNNNKQTKQIKKKKIDHFHILEV